MALFETGKGFWMCIVVEIYTFALGTKISCCTSALFWRRDKVGKERENTEVCEATTNNIGY